MSDIAAIITALASTAIEGAITGIAKAYDVVPSDVTLPLPCVINHPHEGTIQGAESEHAMEMFGGPRMTIHHIKTQVLCSLQSDLQDSERQARPFLSRFVSTVDRFKTLNGTVNIVDATITQYKYGLITLRAGLPDYLGWEFIVRVIEVEQGTNLFGSTGPAS